MTTVSPCPTRLSGAPDRTKQINLMTILRGIAAWHVVAYHFREYLPRGTPDLVLKTLGAGFLAVDLFFILSGFVIYLNYHRLFAPVCPPAFRAFIASRIARIYPLHATVNILYLLNVLAVYLFSSQKTFSRSYDPIYYISSFFLIHNWGFFDFLAWNVPSWSISVEFFSYLLFPFVCVVLATGWWRHASQGLLAVAALLIVAYFYSHRLPSIGDDIPASGLVRCVLEFTMGACVAWMFINWGRPSGRQQVVSLVLAIVIFAAGSRLQLQDYVYVPAAFCFLVYGLSVDPRAARFATIVAPLIYLGQISYSTYMIHFFVREWIKFLFIGSQPHVIWPFVFYVLIVLGLSVLLFHGVEEPGRRYLRRKLDPRPGA